MISRLAGLVFDGFASMVLRWRKLYAPLKWHPDVTFISSQANGFSLLFQKLQWGSLDLLVDLGLSMWLVIFFVLVDYFLLSAESWSNPFTVFMWDRLLFSCVRAIVEATAILVIDGQNWLVSSVKLSLLFIAIVEEWQAYINRISCLILSWLIISIVLTSNVSSFISWIKAS